MIRRTWLPVVCLVPLLAALCIAQPPGAPNPGGAPNPPPLAVAALGVQPTAAEDEQTLKDAKVGVDGPSLVAYFQQHTTPPDQQERIRALIRLLGDDSYRVREQASADLAKLGAAAVPFLRRALSDPDEEIKERAETLMKDADGTDARAAQSAAAARLIRQRPQAVAAAALLGRVPDGGNGPVAVEALAVLAVCTAFESDAAAALLAYVPDADADAVEDEVVASLAVLAVHDGKVDAAVVAALKDKAPSRRAAAAVAIGRSGTAEQRAAVQALLADPDPHVRFRAAQGLLAGRDRAAVPALVALVKDGPTDLARRADELLSCTIGPRGPHVPYGDDQLSQQNCQKAWAAWAQKNAKSVDLAHAEVDLPQFNQGLRARDVVRRCFNALVQGDLPAFKNSTDVPFHNFGEPTYPKRDNLDTVFNNNPMGIRSQPFYPLLMGTAPLQEFTLPNGSPDDKAFVAGYKPGELIVLVVQQQQFGAPNQADASQGNLFLVRLTGDQPHVIGISQNRQGIRYY